VVKASTREINAAIEGVNYVTLENLLFEGGNLKGLSVAFANNILVQNCEFNQQGATALHGDYVNNVLVKGGSVNSSFSNGINFEHDANFCTIDGVTVNNSNIYPGTGRSGSGVGIGIAVTGNNTTITNNRVIGAGYSGVQFLGNNVLVERNFIEKFCLLKDDGGGVYTFNGAANQTHVNRKIKNNIIVNAVGSFAGAEKYYYEAFGKAAGVYLDEYVNNVEISGNTIANGDWGGIFLHNAYNCQINNNIIYNHRYQVHVSQYTAATRNNTMLNNQYIARTASQYTWYYRTFVADNPGTMGNFNNNYYARPINDNQTILIDNNFGSSWSSQIITLTQWKGMALTLLRKNLR
jgi:parallel beta-helix repeat protein